MHALFVKVDNYFRKVELFLLAISCISMFGVMVLVTIDVLLRNLFNRPIIGVFEIVSISLIGIIVFGFSYVQSTREHIIIEVFTQKLPMRYQNVLNVCGCLIGLFVFGILAWLSVDYTISSYQNREYTMGLLRIPLWPSKLLMAIGMVVFSVRLLLDTLQMLSRRES
jgi:TRAP-type C4-dicarboxylate transport system permease small subunit